MPLLSSIARIKKIDFFLKNLSITSKILEIGPGDGWVAGYLKKKAIAIIPVWMSLPRPILSATSATGKSWELRNRASMS